MEGGSQQKNSMTFVGCYCNMNVLCTVIPCILLLNCRRDLINILQCIQISKRGVDYPETGNFKPEELHDYPPRIVCRFYPEDHTPQRTTCTLSFTGFDEEVEFNVLLMAPAQRQVETRILQVY